MFPCVCTYNMHTSFAIFWVIKGTDSNCSWVEFPLPLGSTLFVFFRWPMFCDSHLCLSLFHMLFVKCGIIFMLAKNIYCSLMIQYMTSTRTVFLSPMIPGAFWRYTQSHDTCVHIIYIHTHIYICNYRSYLARIAFILCRCLASFFDTGYESDGERKKSAGAENFEHSCQIFPLLSRILLILKFQSSHCVEYMARREEGFQT